jgi:hypothetical protein
MEKDKKFCWMNCGREAGPGKHHLIFQSQAPELADHPRNQVDICINCHRVIHDGKMEQIAKLQGFQKMMNRIRELSEQHYQRWIIKLDKAGIKAL